MSLSKYYVQNRKVSSYVSACIDSCLLKGCFALTVIKLLEMAKCPCWFIVGVYKYPSSGRRLLSAHLLVIAASCCSSFALFSSAHLRCITRKQQFLLEMNAFRLICHYR